MILSKKGVLVCDARILIGSANLMELLKKVDFASTLCCKDYVDPSSTHPTLFTLLGIRLLVILQKEVHTRRLENGLRDWPGIGF